MLDEGRRLFEAAVRDGPDALERYLEELSSSKANLVIRAYCWCVEYAVKAVLGEEATVSLSARFVRPGFLSRRRC